MKTDTLNEKDLLAHIEQLQSDSKTYRDFFAHMANAVYVMDKGAVFLEVNEAAARMFGYPKSFFKGKSSAVFRAPREKKNKEALEKAFRGEVSRFVFWGIRSNGEVFPQTVCLSKGFYFEQEVVYAVTVDTGDLKKCEMSLQRLRVQLKESERLKAAFLANISYEIRTPLNGILGSASLLKDSDMGPEDRDKFLDIIKQSGERMLSVLDDLINISKIESGQMTISYERVNLSQLLGEVYNFFFPEVRSKGLDLILSIDPLLKTSQIETDRKKLYEVLSNLVRNAIEYSDTGQIEVVCYPKRDGIEFIVKDQGVGIYKEMQERLFDPFLQTNSADRLSSQGAGLGLAICRSYVELLGGDIWVESLPYKGSSFYFTISKKQSSSSLITPYPKELTPLPDNEKSEERLKGLKVLVAEDDNDSALFLSRALQEIVGEVIVVHTGLDAVRVFKENGDIDLILMDIKMPRMNGYEATKEIRKFNKKVIIIAQTAFGLIGDDQKAIEIGCNDHIAKPIRIAALKEKMFTYFSPSAEADRKSI